VGVGIGVGAAGVAGDGVAGDGVAGDGERLESEQVPWRDVLILAMTRASSFISMFEIPPQRWQ